MLLPLPFAEPGERGRLVAAGRQPVQTEDAASPGQLDQRHPLLVTGLEAHGRPGGNVEPHAERLGTVEAPAVLCRLGGDMSCGTKVPWTLVPWTLSPRGRYISRTRGRN